MEENLETPIELERRQIENDLNKLDDLITTFNSIKEFGNRPKAAIFLLDNLKNVLKELFLSEILEDCDCDMCKSMDIEIKFAHDVSQSSH